ncbi:arginine--tRNA ligase [Actinomadura citrea]|uniref:Arginine--tRNA ligase n=1 Tax=Actinomadura citrea TaxID=46158 RepID=A0A7Y9G782_9ACTN|nr:arginine--tRNA ligase [Actinomadura citrea]NYE11041.1 arginyl-tRNA synthetase [Actinomadura citrea]GGU07907.1 arginine--tRNA ligase [Actinomadura citrea]
MNPGQLRFTEPGPSPVPLLADRFRAALSAAFGRKYGGVDPLIRPSQHADLQANVAMALAKDLDQRDPREQKRDPREVAQEIVDRLYVEDVVSEVRISGPGFINMTLSDEWIVAQLKRISADERLAVRAAALPQRVVVEFSSPNVAKVMHVGHLRTTIVGDAIARILEFLGHDVIRDNHIGDWGTPFGMLIEYLLDFEGGTGAGLDAFVSDTGAFYKAAHARFESDEEFAGRARRRLVALQAGDEATLRYWRRLVDVSMRSYNALYERLGVKLTDDDVKGESFYNEILPQVVDELEANRLAVPSDGALCVFLPEFRGRDGGPKPVIVRKSDGGYNYTTTDLATILYRVDELHANRIIYVVGDEQTEHFELLFAIAQRANFLFSGAVLEHAKIGLVTDPRTGSKLKSRSGEAVKLSELLDGATERATAALIESGRGEMFDEATRAAIIDAVAVGAVRFADLLVARDSKYPFDLDRMIAFTGKSAGFVQYAGVRMKSVLRKGGLTPESAVAPILIGAKEERDLALHLLDFGITLEQAGAAAEPHQLAGYLYELARFFTAFYEACPVLKDGIDEETRASRMALCAVTLRTLVTGLDLLGVPAPDRM